MTDTPSRTRRRIEQPKPEPKPKTETATRPRRQGPPGARRQAAGKQAAVSQTAVTQPAAPAAPHSHPVGYLDPGTRKEFILIFDVINGNPNGDPDAGNMPRTDPETGHGIVTDVAIKRKVRNYVDAAAGTELRNKIYVQQGTTLNEQHRRSYTSLNLPVNSAKKQAPESITRWMCDNFYDVRIFGAMMATDINAGQVRGPVQINFAESVDPVTPTDIAITRIVSTDNKASADEDGWHGGTIGRKTYIPYGLFVATGFYVPTYATRTGVTSDDLSLLWKALVNMWDLDRSASKGRTACRGLYVFSHDNALGTCPAHFLFERLRISRNPDVAIARAHTDYTIAINDNRLPKGVTLNRLDLLDE